MKKPRKIISTKDTCGGELRFEGTRIPINIVKGYSDYYSQQTAIKYLLEDYPELTEEDIENAQKYLILK